MGWGGENGWTNSGVCEIPKHRAPAKGSLMRMNIAFLIGFRIT